MPYTVPNQRVVTIHREKARSDFLGIKNENWQSAARDLGAHALPWIAPMVKLTL